jgi:hypothetical protein
MAVDLITGAAFGVQTVQISIRQVSPSSSHGRAPGPPSWFPTFASARYRGRELGV